MEMPSEHFVYTCLGTVPTISVWEFDLKVVDTENPILENLQNEKNIAYIL